MKITFQSYYAMGFHAALDKQWIWVNFVQSDRSDLSSITAPVHGILTNPRQNEECLYKCSHDGIHVSIVK